MIKTNIVLSIALLAGLSSCDKAKSGSEKASADTDKATVVAPELPKPTKTLPTAGAAATFKDAAGTYTIDGSHTKVVFSIRHMGLSDQYGMFTGIEGSFTLDADPTASKLALSFPTASIYTAAKKRDDHLKSPDFFDAKQFPMVEFKSTEIKSTGENTFSVTGDLSLHGATRPVTINLTHGGSATDPDMMGGKFRVGFNGDASFKRSDFGMNFMVGAGLDDEVNLLLSLEGTRN